MRNVFLRLFLSIVSITLIILCIQTVLVMTTTNQMRRNWSQEVYQTYLERIKQIVQEEVPPEGWTIDNIWAALLKAADDRISGLLIRNNDGELVASFGKTSRGALLPVPAGKDGSAGEDILQMPNIHNTAAFSQDIDVGSSEEAAAPSSDKSVVVPLTNVKITVIDKGKAQSSGPPPDIRAQDVTGTVELFYSGKKIGSVDVLTFTPMTYKFTSDLVRNYLATFLLTIPIALIVSLILGFFISRRNVRFSESISQALLGLAEGKRNVSLPTTRLPDYKRMLSSISHLDQRLQDHERARQAWLCGISHDLNTPVTSMKLLLDGMEDGIFPIDEQHVRMVGKENALLQRRIQSVVTYSTLQSPDTVATFVDVDSLELIDSVLRQLPPDQAERVDVQVDVPRLSCDASMMQLACKELVDNALAATEGTVLWKLQAIAAGKGGGGASHSRSFEMDFVNDGVIDTSKVDFFEPWTRGDASRTASGGSGLGLSIVGQVMRQHGGVASIRSLEAMEGTSGKIIVQLVWPENGKAS